MKTLIIHPKDASTDFLKPIYWGIKDKTVVTGGISKKEVQKLIQEHDRVMMMGHGSPWGLFSIGQFHDCRGLIIGDEDAELLRGKDNVYIWCNADQFVAEHELSGFYSGMFVSEVSESIWCGVDSEQSVVTESNNFFAQLTGKFANEPSSVIYENVKPRYEEFAKNNIVAGYNSERLYFAEVFSS